MAPGMDASKLQSDSTSRHLDGNTPGSYAGHVSVDYVFISQMKLPSFQPHSDVRNLRSDSTPLFHVSARACCRLVSYKPRANMQVWPALVGFERTALLLVVGSAGLRHIYVAYLFYQCVTASRCG